MLLQKIVDNKKDLVKEKKQNPDYVKKIKEEAFLRQDIKNFLSCCEEDKIRIIAEIKQASPSEGLIKRLTR